MTIYRDAEQISDCQCLRLGDNCGYERATRGIVVVMETCILTAPMSISAYDIVLKFCKILPLEVTW